MFHTLFVMFALKLQTLKSERSKISLWEHLDNNVYEHSRLELLENKTSLGCRVCNRRATCCRCLPTTRPSCSDRKRNVQMEKSARFPQRWQSVAGSEFKIILPSCSLKEGMYPLKKLLFRYLVLKISGNEGPLL